MKQWKDSQGREWQLKLTPPEIARLRDASGIDVYKIIDGSIRLDDIDQVCRLVWSSIESQAKAAGVIRSDFEDQFDSEVIENFTTALIAESVRFFPSALRTLAEKIAPKVIDQRAQAKAALALVTDEMIDEAILKSQSGNSSESSDAIPQPSIASST